MFATKMQHDIPGFNMYAAAAAATGQAGTSALNSPSNYAVAAAAGPTRGIVPHYGSTGMDASPYYTPMGGGYDMKTGGDLWGNSYGQPAPAYYPYDGGFAPQYPYDRYCGMDMNDGVRRKNATRESTNTLKAWLQEHKKNPYPTKGEKIMLAIITKMTLTQVSTWFANARRRLKKENKMTWIPKNRANESGSGTEDRRMSDDKDTDDKTEDGDCKSENDDNDRVSSDIKSDAENENCQYTTDKQPAYTFNKDREGAMGESVNSDVISHSSIESQNIHPDPSYQRIMSQNPCEESTGNAHESVNLQNSAPPSGMRPRNSVEGRDRSIWSPISHQAQQTTPHIPHPYSASYDTDVHYPNRSAYPAGQYGQHLPAANPPQYTPDPTISPFRRQAPFHSGSQGYISPPNRTPSSSYSGFQGRQSLSYPMEYPNKLENPSNLPIDSALNSSARSDCRFTSPVTNLQNYVNGVFHAPETGRPSSPSTASCDKIASMPKTSPNPHTDTSSGHSISPTGQMHYRGHGYNQRYVNTVDVAKDSDTMDASINEAYPLQQPNHLTTYTSNGYYGRSMILQDMKHSCSKQDKEQQGEGAHFSYHNNPDIQSPPNVPGNNIENPSICPQNEVTGQFPFINHSITGGTGRTLHVPNPKPYLPGSDGSQSLVGHSHSISSNDQICSTANSQSLPYYNMQTKNCISSAVLPNAPPPLYSSQCQYAHNGAPRSNNPECPPQNMENSNPTETVLSTTVTDSGLSPQENCNFESKRAPCDEKGKRNEIQAAEALTNLSTR